MIPIDKHNYFSKDHKGLSQSMIKNYLKCPNYFYRHDVLKEIEHEDKKCYDIGTIVDNILTEQENLDDYVVVEGDGRLGYGQRAKASDSCSRLTPKTFRCAIQ